MALSNRDRLGKSLDLLAENLRQWVGQQLIGRFGADGIVKAQEFIVQSARAGSYVPQTPQEWDIPALLTIIFNMWTLYFGDLLGSRERTWLHELQTIRNDWAHQKAFGTDDTLRALDTIVRLLRATSADRAASEVEKLHGELLRTMFTERQRTASNRAQRQATEGAPQEGLRPWREVIVPHIDVREGNFTQAEFAADLAQVFRGGASSEYGDPKEFFRRTYITEGLSGLIVNALKRLNGEGGHPVIDLQTNFGGGKTHSMLALYHLVSGEDIAQLTGIDDLLRDANVKAPPAHTKRAVLVGTALAPGQPEKTKDGLSLNTLWGRMAYQLGGKDAYALIEDSDKHSTSPGSDDLVRLFKQVGPCLILIDEWVAFCRQTYETHGLPGGTFDQNLTFAQALTEAVKASPQALLVASLPQSAIEVGGTGGKEALASLSDTFGRLEFNWRPANQQESYEIVRRRLFEPIADPNLFAERDAAISAFFGAYANNKNDFPSHVSDGEYEKRMRAAYPVHPELFDRLYNDWASLEEFQRTRGVLRLMATVIHVLWTRNERSLMIMPGLIPMDEPTVTQELTRYLQDNWQVIMGAEIDGHNSLPTRIDSESARFGQFWAARRVARTVYMGSAPSEGRSNKGIDIRNVLLGCVQPGENIAVFGDALRQLGDNASHLYGDGSRYWFATQPNVLTMARDKAARIEDSDRLEEINKFIRSSVRDRAAFFRVHAAISDSGDITDEPETRLVIFSADKTHSQSADSSPALAAAMEWLDRRGNAPRIHRNALVFVAPDKARLDDLKSAAAMLLAWRYIYNERERLNLDPFNVNMAQTRLVESESVFNSRIPETFQWLIVPSQPTPLEKISWNVKRLSGAESIADRAWNKLKREDLLRDNMAGTVLRFEMDRYLWKDLRHISVKQLVAYFSQYLYLPRLSQPSVAIGAIQDGVNRALWNPETFAYADRYDEGTGRYMGLAYARILPNIALDGMSVLVKPSIAQEQITMDAAKIPQATGPGTSSVAIPAYPSGAPIGQGDETAPIESSSTRYYGSIDIGDATRLIRDVGVITNEIVQHLTSIVGAEVSVSLEIHARVPHGLTPQQIRTLTENSRTLKFRDFGIE